jgi:hypothetical protein
VVKRIGLAIVVVSLAVLGACQPPPAQTGGGSTGTGVGSPVDNSAGDPLDSTNLPLGDYHLSQAPSRGDIWSCQAAFVGGGATGSTPWIRSNGTWDATAKPVVQGDVSWPGASFSISLAGSNRVVSGNGLPVGYTTGVYPIQPSDPAYQYDKNPNSIKTQSISYTLPATPTPAAKSSCVPGGMIGVALDGVPIFNGLDAGGRDAVAHELQDHCGGHPQQQGMYHYHSISDCLPGANSSDLIGYANDGFGIYGPIDSATGKELTDADLDECHGTTSPVMWDGQLVNMYHYVATRAYPYTVSCFRGTPVSVGA